MRQDSDEPHTWAPPGLNSAQRSRDPLPMAGGLPPHHLGNPLLVKQDISHEVGGLAVTLIMYMEYLATPAS